MKKARILEDKKKTNKNIEIQNEISLKKLIFTILAVTLVFFVFYFITTLVVKPVKKSNTNNSTITKSDDSEILLNHLLDRKEEKYYVLATKKSLYDDYSSQTDYIKLYKNYINQYSSKEESLNVYFVDLDNSMNKSYISDESNIVNDLSALKLNDETLFKIENGEIKESYIGNKKIIEALSKLN